MDSDRIPEHLKKRAQEVRRKKMAAAVQGGGGGGNVAGGSSVTVSHTPTPDPERVKAIKDRMNWDDAIANAVAQFEIGRLDQARFLLDVAKELRQMDALRAEQFEALKAELENES